MFTARTTWVSNPFRSPGFRPSPSDPFWCSAFATGSPRRIIAFYRSPSNTLHFSRSQVLQSLLLAVTLSATISQKIYKTGYERFRPNNYGSHLRRRCYRGGWHRSYPPLIRQGLYSWQKPILMYKHWGFPSHAFAHWREFVPAAPRRARASVPVPFSGLSR